MTPAWAQRREEMLSDCLVSPDVFNQMVDRLDEFVVPYQQALVTEADQHPMHLYLQGLLSQLQRKNAEGIAAWVDVERQVMQDFIGTAPWEHRPLLQVLVGQVADRLGEPDGIIAFDPSSFPKRGTHSVGVKRQWCGHRGKVDTCQVGVFMGYVSGQGHALLDFRLSRRAKIFELALPRQHAQDACLFFITSRDLKHRGGDGTLLRFHQLHGYGGFAGFWITADHLGNKTLHTRLLQGLHHPQHIGTLTIASHVLAKGSEIHELLARPDLCLATVVGGQQQMLTGVARHRLPANLCDGVRFLGTLFRYISGVFDIKLGVRFRAIVEYVYDVRMAELHHQRHLHRHACRLQRSRLYLDPSPYRRDVSLHRSRAVFHFQRHLNIALEPGEGRPSNDEQQEDCPPPHLHASLLTPCQNSCYSTLDSNVAYFY